MKRARRTHRRGEGDRLPIDRASLAAIFGAIASASLVASCSTTPATTPATDATVETSIDDATLDQGLSDPGLETNDAAEIDEIAIADVADATVDEVFDAYDPGLLDACAPTHADTGNLEETSALCTRYYDLPCALPPDIKPLGGCRIDVNDCVKLCDYDVSACTIVGPGCIDGTYVSVVGPITVYCDLCGAAGRRPQGLRRSRGAGARGDLGLYFSTMATLEAASAPAFRAIVGALRALGAPRGLITSASRAARDEVRHARMTTRLARRFGAHPRPPRIATTRRQSLEGFARDNEVEGCVRESFAALLVTVQAMRARDRDVAATLRRIADDETRHAALSLSISRWARAKLSNAANTSLDRDRDEALDALARHLRDPSSTIASIAGVPDLATQRALLAAMRARLF